MQRSPSLLAGGRENGRKKKVPHQQRSLFGVIEALVGQPIAIELKDDSIIDGVLHELMWPSTDMTMTNVTFTKLNASPMKVATMYVRGSLVRYIVFPDHLNIRSVLKKQQERKQLAINYYGRSKRG
jgi:small nuclear ribonucleoprotein (snRNP)-like protein